MNIIKLSDKSFDTVSYTQEADESYKKQTDQYGCTILNIQVKNVDYHLKNIEVCVIYESGVLFCYSCRIDPDISLTALLQRESTTMRFLKGSVTLPEDLERAKVSQLLKCSQFICFLSSLFF